MVDPYESALFLLGFVLAVWLMFSVRENELRGWKLFRALVAILAAILFMSKLVEPFMPKPLNSEREAFQTYDP